MFITFTLFILFSTVLCCDSEARMDSLERIAVNEIMIATGNSWVSSVPDVCENGGAWRGIECEKDGQGVPHVVSLSFGPFTPDSLGVTFAENPNCSSNSQVSPLVGRLKFLKKLVFDRCCIHSPHPIPPEIGLLGSKLQFLALRNNGHIGHVPQELANLSNMDTLDLAGNSLAGSVSPMLDGMAKLRSLNLEDNQFGGVISPNIFEGKDNLVILRLSKNRFTGSIPENLGRMRLLQYLDLSNNSLSGSIPTSLCNLRNLCVLKLDYNLLSGSLATSLGNLTALLYLDMSYSNLDGSIPKEIGSLFNLQVLRLRNNHLDGSLPGALGFLPGLAELDVRENFLTGLVNFPTEFILRLGPRFKFENNSDLCFDSKLLAHIREPSPPAAFLKLPFRERFLKVCSTGGKTVDVGKEFLHTAVPTLSPYHQQTSSYHSHSQYLLETLTSVLAIVSILLTTNA